MADASGVKDADEDECSRRADEGDSVMSGAGRALGSEMDASNRCLGGMVCGKSIMQKIK